MKENKPLVNQNIKQTMDKASTSNVPPSPNSFEALSLRVVSLEREIPDLEREIPKMVSQIQSLEERLATVMAERDELQRRLGERKENTT